LYVLNGKQFAVKEVFLDQFIKALTEAGFTIPNTPIIAK
ncbi:mechanosensitive ion channel family protein, partial [Enterococcus faecalis]